VFLGCRLLGEHEEVVENLLRKLVVIEELAARIGYDEFVRLLAIRNGKRIVVFIFHDADDLELILLALRRFDDENILQFDFAFAAVFTLGTVVRVDLGPP